jgi:hypothetical protein
MPAVVVTIIVAFLRTLFAHVAIASYGFHSMLLFIGVTSSPNHVDLRGISRKTFLSACQESNSCQFKFFIDSSNPSQLMRQEAAEHKDIVFRESCSLMNKYPSHMHYGIFNALQDVNGSLPWYRLYKIEWKISFMRWIAENLASIPQYIAFIEDDSFVCLDHLLYQMRLLSNNPSTPFRTGSYICKDGCSFDDSSTLMSGEIATMFVQNYPSDQFDCPNVKSTANLPSNAVVDWGRSWRERQCNWKHTLHKNGLEVIHPDTYCKHAYAPFSSVGDVVCESPLPLIFHTNGHEITAPMVLRERGLYGVHMCEHLLLIDKVNKFLPFAVAY